MTPIRAKYQVLFSLMGMLSLGGCATGLTVTKISPGENKEYDYVAEVTAAYRDAAGDVTACVTGKPAGANYWIPGNQEYTLTFPASTSPDLSVLFHKTIPQYLITAADVKRECPKNQDSLTPLPILTVHARNFGSPAYAVISEEALATFLDTRARAPAIYVFDYDLTSDHPSAGAINIVYVSEKPIRDDVHAVEIATEFRTLEPKPAYVLLLPFAFVFDVVTFPVQLLFVLTYE